MFYAFHILIILMSFTGYENHITFLTHHTSCADSFFSVNDGNYIFHLLSIESGKHIINNILWFFEAWIVTRYNYLVTLFCSFLCHYRTFSFVTISTGPAYSDDMSLTV